MKVRDAIRLVEADGWVHSRTRGSHRRYKHPMKPGKVTISGHPSKDLTPGMERSILRQAGLWRSGLTPNSADDYLIVIEEGDDSFGAYAPDLPGCVAAADTLEECEQLMREAIVFHLEAMRDGGDPIPEPTIAAAAFVPAA